MDKDKEQVLREFFKALRIVISNAAIYTAGHVVLMKSVEELKDKIDRATVVFGNIQLFFGPKFLMVDEQRFEGDPLFEDIAKFFHHRNVKSLTFRRGVTIDELDFFLSKAALRAKEIIKQGGLEAVLQKRSFLNLAVEMLDYSLILKSVKEDKDIWAFLLKKAIDEGNFEQVDAIIDSFDQMIRDVGIRELVESEQLFSSVVGFLNFIKHKKDHAYFQCVRQLTRAILRNTDQTEELQIPEALKEFILSLDANDLSDVLIDDVLDDENFQMLVFEFFCQLIPEKKHQIIAAALKEKIKNKASYRVTQEWFEKIRDLISGSQNSIIKGVYQPVFSDQKEDPSDDVFGFDRESQGLHFRRILLTLFAEERREEWLMLIAQNILSEWVNIEPEQKIGQYHVLLEQVQKKKGADSSLNHILWRIESFVAQHIEQMVLDGDTTEQLTYFVNTLTKSSLGVQPYLEKIFVEGTITPHLLRSFFNFFPRQIPDFYEKLSGKYHDTKFMLEFIKSSRGLPPMLTIDLLKHIFLSSNVYIKIEVVRIMQTLPTIDEDFLAPILVEKTENIRLKEETLKVFMMNDETRRKVVSLLSVVPNSMGKNNGLIEENIWAIGAVRLKEAQEYLENLAENKSFWNRSVRHAAQKVLGQLKNG